MGFDVQRPAQIEETGASLANVKLGRPYVPRPGTFIVSTVRDFIFLKKSVHWRSATPHFKSKYGRPITRVQAVPTRKLQKTFLIECLRKRNSQIRFHKKYVGPRNIVGFHKIKVTNPNPNGLNIHRSRKKNRYPSNNSEKNMTITSTSYLVESVRDAVR